MAKTLAQYRAHGAQYSSGPVNTEGRDAAQRWEGDLTELAPYGYTRKKLQGFRALLTEHDTARMARPDGVSAKTSAVESGRGVVAEAHRFLGRAYSNLGVLAEDHDGLEAEIATIRKQRRDGIDLEVASAVACLEAHRSLLDPDTAPEALIAAGQALVPRLKASVPAKSSAATAAKTDTEALDVLDGRVLEVVSGLNSAGRKAFRALGNKTKVEAYKYHHIRGKPSETATDAPPAVVPPVTP